MSRSTLREVMLLRQPAWLMLVVVIVSGHGCKAVKFVGKTTAATVSATADVTSVAVRDTGKIACTAADVSLDVASFGIKEAAKLSKRGAVVFFNPRTGLVVELPWRKNLTLLAATQVAGLSGATQAVRLIRAGQAIEAARREAQLVLAPGDVVELVQRKPPVRPG